MIATSATYDLLRQCPYAIVDPLRTETFPVDIASTPLVPLWLRGQASQLPCLVQLGGMAAELTVRLLEILDRETGMQEAPCIAMLIFTDADAGPDALRAHLVDRLTIRHRGRQALLRYYDPRVFLQLTWMLTPGQLGWLLGPIDRVAGWVSGQWRVFDKLNAAGDSRLADTATLARIGLINDVLAVTDCGPDTAQIIALSRRIERALRRAETHGLHNEDDRIAFATHAVSVHDEFDAHPQIAALLESRDAETSYRDAARLLDEADWQRIGNDLHNKNLARIAP